MYVLYYPKDEIFKITPKDRVLMDLYTLNAKIPSAETIQTYLKKGTNEKIKTHFRTKTIDEIKKDISMIDDYVPLYDEYQRNMFMISKEHVYDKVVHQSYRFPGDDLIEVFQQRKKEYEKVKDDDPLKARELRKICYMLEFLNYFHMPTLKATYTKVFYEMSEYGGNITVCIRPSFLKNFTHLKPYYTKSELINMALNMELKVKITNNPTEDIMKLCDIIKQNDISSKILVNHQNHIIKQKKIGIVKYYSFQGSYFMNKYLRHQMSYDTKHPVLEHAIESFDNLIKTAPPFDKSYIVYRFVYDDVYINHLKIGDVYVSNSFMSTTRDPFYRADTYAFGFILIKIKLPANVKGAGLCIESFSNFQQEQEIVLPPGARLRLDKRDDNTVYYHTDESFAADVKTKYEFTYLGINEISWKRTKEGKIGSIDFVSSLRTSTITLTERVSEFMKEHVGKMKLFRAQIGDKEYDIITESYDSTKVYKRFYAVTTNSGFSMYTLHDSHLLFVIEMSDVDTIPTMYVNYYFKYTTVGNNGLSDQDLLLFVSKVSYYFGIQNVVLYSDYATCDSFGGILGDVKFAGGNFCVDHYMYLKDKIKRYGKCDSSEIKPKFSYHELDRLHKMDPSKVLSHYDRDELYQIYEKVYQPEHKNPNISQFWIWIVENYCSNADIFIDKLDKIYKKDNPFTVDYYLIDPFAVLYNRNIISEYDAKSVDEKELAKTSVDKNVYRLDYDKNIRVPSKFKCTETYC